MYSPKQWIQEFLAKPIVTRSYRRLLRRTPRLQDVFGLCLYYYRKRAIRSAVQLTRKEIGTHLKKAEGTEDRQFLIDISSLVSRHDRTGIYRVVSNLLEELSHSPPAGFSVKPVYADAAGQLRYARNYTQQVLTGAKRVIDDPV